MYLNFNLFLKKILAKNKRLKFSQITDYSNVVEPTFDELQSFPLKNHWNQAHFKNDKPIVLELGCGKGEYTVSLAQEYPQKNFIGIDIKEGKNVEGSHRRIITKPFECSFSKNPHRVH